MRNEVDTSQHRIQTTSLVDTQRQSSRGGTGLEKKWTPTNSRDTHDDASAMALDGLVGNAGGLDVVEAEAALGAEPTPVAVVVAVDAAAYGLAAHLLLFMREKQHTAEALEENTQSRGVQKSRSVLW